MTDQEFEVFADRYNARRRENDARTRPYINYHVQYDTARRLTPHLLRVIEKSVTVMDFDLVCIP